MSYRNHSGLCLGILILAAGAPGLALAQAQAAQAQGKQPSLEEVTVTGSRIGRTGFESPQPVSVIDSSQIQNLGLVNVGDVLRQLPQNSAFVTDTNVGFGNFNVGAQLANLRGLNPFFGTRTLTLVDTQRVVPNTEGGAVDLTLIPSMLVARTEVVTGGASAAYGSDAIAGVVNVILDTKLTGLKAQVDYGETGQSDGKDRHASFAYGKGFNDDKIHFIVGAEYQHQDGIGPCSKTRDWCKQSWGIGTNSAYATGNGYPNYVLAPNAKFPTSDTGLITPFGGSTLSFNTAGTALVPYDPGQFAGVFSRIGGDGNLLAYDLSTIRPDTKRYSALGHVDIKLSDSTNLSFEVDNAHSDSLNYPANGALGPIVMPIAPDNAFLTPAVQAQMPIGGIFNRLFAPDVLSARNTTKADTVRFVTTVKGGFADKWNYDAYYEHGRSTYHQRLFHNVVGAILPFPTVYNFLGWAIDAVHSNPADPTSPIVCRATLPTSPTYSPLAAGCVPLNFFGIGNSDPAALDYAFRTLKEDSTYRQDAVGANFRADLAKTWAGTLAGAFGLELRNDREVATHDLANQPWYPDYFLDWRGDRGGKINVAEVYGEIQLPLAKKLQSDFAVRETRNEATSDAAGSVTNTHNFATWKASLVYNALDWLRFRTTRSRDVRAAGFRELFLPRQGVIGVPGGFPNGINNPWNGGAPEQYLNYSGGNPNLKPETADTTTFGTVFTFDKSQFSVDWYQIDLKDAITSGGIGGLSAQQIVQACYDGGPGAAACNSVGGAGTTDITFVDASTINVGSYLTRGFDFEYRYNTSVGRGSNLNLRVIASNLYDMIINTGLGDPPRNYAGQSGPTGAFGGFNTSPDWQATAFLTYSHSRFTTTVETRFINSGTLNATYFESPPGAASNTIINSINDNSVAGRIYVTWSGSYDFRQNSDNSMQLFWVINNLFDKDPPVAPGGNFFPTNPVYFDTLGRRMRVGVRFRF